MSKAGRVFGRNRNKEGEMRKLVIQEKAIRILVNEWLGRLYWKPKAFESVLEQAGIEFPAVLSDYDEDNQSFICTTSRGKKYILHIALGDCDDFPEISVTEGDEVRKYEIRFNFTNDDNPIITFVSREFKVGDRKITGTYDFLYRWKVEYGNHELIKVLIMVPRNYRIDAKKCKEAEEYLLALELKPKVDIRNIYETLIDMLSLSSETVEQCKKISVKYSEKNGKDWDVKSKIMVESGNIIEYQLFRQGNIYHVYSNGNWEYVGKEGVKITSDDDIITVSITGNTDKIASSNPHSLLQQAEYVIGLLYESVW